MGCGDKKLSKYLTQTFTAHCNAMICQQVTLSGDAEWPKVADAVIEAAASSTKGRIYGRNQTMSAQKSPCKPGWVHIWMECEIFQLGRGGRLFIPYEGGRLAS